MGKPLVAMIAAIGANNIIGNDSEIPWRLPSDFAFFKRTTLGKPLIMGRKTFESIGRPLPGRTNIVVTTRPGYQPDGVIVINDLHAAIAHGRTIAEADGVDEVMIGGGGEIYRQALSIADRLYITHVDVAPEGDAAFPAIDANVWANVAEPDIPRSEKDSASYKTVVYERRASALH